jgi:hypothetical protein
MMGGKKRLTALTSVESILRVEAGKESDSERGYFVLCIKSNSLKARIDFIKGVFTLSVALCRQRQATMDRIASNFVSDIKRHGGTEFSLFM